MLFRKQVKHRMRCRNGNFHRRTGFFPIRISKGKILLLNLQSGRVTVVGQSIEKSEAERSLGNAFRVAG